MSVERLSGAAGDKHKEYYHTGTFSVKYNLEMTERKGDIGAVLRREGRKTRKRAIPFAEKARVAVILSGRAGTWCYAGA